MRVEGDMRTEGRKDVLLETTGGAASKSLPLTSNQHKRRTIWQAKEKYWIKRN